jgi:hypothetical protein
MTLVELYSKDDCRLCDEAKVIIERVQQLVPFIFREFKLMPGDQYFEDYKEMFPVVHINKVQAFKYRVSENMLKIKLQQLAGESRAPDVDPDEPAMERH